MLLKSLDPLFLKKLHMLHYSSRKASLASQHGDLIVNKRGTGIEFMEYKEYCLGDDFKHIDWNIYGRLDRLYVKLFHAERSLTVYILLDASKSMLLPRIDQKFQYALKTALALSYVALVGQHRVKVSLVAGKSKSKNRGLVTDTPYYTGSHNVIRVAEFLEQVQPGGVANLGESIKRSIYNIRDVGTALLISDFLMDPAQYRRSLSMLRFKNFDINAIHILGQTEQNPINKVGKLKVRDIETNEERIVHLNEANLKKYRYALEKHREAIRGVCLSNRAVYSLAQTDTPVETFVLKELPRMGLLH